MCIKSRGATSEQHYTDKHTKEKGIAASFTQKPRFDPLSTIQDIRSPDFAALTRTEFRFLQRRSEDLKQKYVKLSILDTMN